MLHASFFDAGMLEIYRFVPPPLLKDVEPAKTSIDDFIKLLAKARYIQEVEAAIIQNGVAGAFASEDEQ